MLSKWVLTTMLFYSIPSNSVADVKPDELDAIDGAKWLYQQVETQVPIIFQLIESMHTTSSYDLSEALYNEYILLDSAATEFRNAGEEFSLIHDGAQATSNNPYIRFMACADAAAAYGQYARGYSRAMIPYGVYEALKKPAKAAELKAMECAIRIGTYPLPYGKSAARETASDLKNLIIQAKSGIEQLIYYASAYSSTLEEEAAQRLLTLIGFEFELPVQKQHFIFTEILDAENASTAKHYESCISFSHTFYHYINAIQNELTGKPNKVTMETIEAEFDEMSAACQIAIQSRSDG